METCNVSIHEKDWQNPKDVTFCNLFCFSCCSEWTMPVNLARVSLLMLFDWPFAGSIRLEWMPLTVFKKSKDITTDSSWIILMWLLTFCNRIICRFSKWQKENISRIDKPALLVQLKSPDWSYQQTFSFWSSCWWDLSSPSFLTVKSSSFTCGSKDILDWPFPAISAQIRAICDWVSVKSFTLCSFFDLRSSKIGLTEDICCLRVPFPFSNCRNKPNQHKIWGTKQL